ncbi:DUF1630-domain-containing protein [Thelephora ganbajun]|uniref:DUF1630-domain-containing protein n=1 Tax=Thelephora ganbajun TaxID=370292 RepID=A0ACB6ZC62_THEGA|nr:DUF1630-domain-containing protein [Thelephora ganbajun]
MQWRPSSPSSDLLDKNIFTPRTLTRSKTVPEPLVTAATIKFEDTTVEDLVFEPEKLTRLRRWILTIAVVDFDLELGPTVVSVFPSLILSHAERENIAFSSFPDSAQFDQGSRIHSFRIRETDHTKNDTLRNDRARPLSNDGFIYGYSHFTQKRDRSFKRGYKQGSLVLLSQFPYPTLFTELISTLGPAFLTHGGPMLEAVCHNIASWPDHELGICVELGFMGNVLHVELPVGLDEQQMQAISSTSDLRKRRPVLAASPPEQLPPLAVFSAAISHLWSIWECLILSEPILVFGTSPTMTSQAIWWLRDFLRPMPLAGDFRPYFTIHDKDHAALVNQNAPQAGLLLGVTNPFYDGTCKHWPHQLSLGDPSQTRHPSLGNQTPLPGPTPGWKTKTHKRYISKDRSLLKILEQVVLKSDSEAQQEPALALRRHFASRTTEFLVPLNRYLNTLIPSPVSSTFPTQKMKRFNEKDFFAMLKNHGSPLPFKSNTKQREFYERWLKSPGFGVWLAKQEELVEAALRQR